jgi:spermidine synthase
MPLPEAPAPAPHEAVRHGAGFRTAIVLAAGSGLLVFAAEVVFVHLLAVVVGTSVYAFGLILFVFLVCLSLGTPVATWLARRFGADALAFGLVTTALALALSSVLWDKIPAVFVALGPAVRVWRSRELVRIACTFGALFVPVVLMGTTFPLVLRAARTASAGADVGRITAANTAGSIVGSLLGGFVVLPALGSQRSVLLVAVAYAALSIVAGRSHAHAASLSRWGPAALVLAVALALPRWDLSRLSSGANVYFDEGVVPRGELEWIEEDIHGGVTTVVRGDDGQRTLLTNGKFQGNDGEELRENRGFAHLPAMFSKGRGPALVIGLGTGTTTGTLGAYDYERIDVAEISPAIVRAARTTFREANDAILDDPRVHLLMEDGRNVLLTRKTQYDLVTIEVTSIWFAGAGNLYNKEFYELVSKRLATGAVLQQWIQLHHTNRRVVTSILATVRAVFPHVLVFVNGHQGHILASHAPLSVSREHLFEMEKKPAIRRSLGGEHLVDFARGLVLDETRLADLITDSSTELDTPAADFVSTDQNMFLEYATPKGNVPGADDVPLTVAFLAGYRTKTLLLAHLSF